MNLTCVTVVILVTPLVWFPDLVLDLVALAIFALLDLFRIPHLNVVALIGIVHLAVIPHPMYLTVSFRALRMLMKPFDSPLRVVLLVVTAEEVSHILVLLALSAIPAISLRLPVLDSVLLVSIVLKALHSRIRILVLQVDMEMNMVFSIRLALVPVLLDSIALWDRRILLSFAVVTPQFIVQRDHLPRFLFPMVGALVRCRLLHLLEARSSSPTPTTFVLTERISIYFPFM